MQICDYLFDLCHLFNIFYETCPVLKAENENERAWRFALCIVTEGTLIIIYSFLLCFIYQLL